MLKPNTFSRPMFFSLSLVLSFVLIATLPALGQTEKGETKESSVSRTAVERLFRKQGGDTASLRLVATQGASQVLRGQVLNHLNQGEESGLVTAILSAGEEEYRLLLSRKVRDKQLSYQFVLVPLHGDRAYRLTGQSPDAFLLTEDAKETVVSE